MCQDVACGLPHSPPHFETPPLGQGLFPEADLPMDNLTACLAELFQRYLVDFRRMAQMSEAEAEQVIEPFRREVDALIVEHGREAVIRAPLQLPAGLPILN
jgi:hypothetical protein